MEVSIKGIKCDNPKCDWKDMSVTWDDFDKTTAEWLNKPCPECGENLLTQEDIDSTTKLAFVMDELGKIAMEVNPELAEEADKDGAEMAVLKVESDGTGDKRITSKDGLIGDYDLKLDKEGIDSLYEILNSPEGRDLLKLTMQSKQN